MIPRIARRRVAVIVAAVSLGAGACTASAPQVDPAQLAELGRETGLKLPATARLAGIHRERGIDSMVQAKLLLTPVEWEQLLRDSPIKLEQLEPGANGLTPDRGFWDPGRCPGLRAGQVRRENGHALNVGFARSGPDVVVYLMDFST